MEENKNLNSADMIFIPSDIKGSISDYTQYRPGFIRTVPANCVLVKKNRFTGRISVVSEKENGKYKTGGLHFLTPFISESILVPVIDRTIDYPVASYYTHDGIEVNVDLALKVRIVDPENYLKYGRYQLDQLNVLTQNLLVEYVKSKEYNELASGRINLDNFDKATPGQKGGVKESAYEDFKKRYGIEIKSVQIKSVKPSPEVQKMLDDAAQAELKQKARRIEMETKKQEAEKEAEIAKIRGKGAADEYRLVEQAKIDILQQMYSVLTDSNMSNNQKVNILQQMIAGKNGTYIHFGGNNGDSSSLDSSISRGIVAGNIASDKVRQGKSTTLNKTNCERILEEIQALITIGMIEQNEEIDSLIRLLTTDEKVKSYVNKLSEEEYRVFANNTLSSYKKANLQSRVRH